VSQAMNEQATSSTEISTAVENLRQQAEQSARAQIEQSRAVKELTVSSENISQQIKHITRANAEHTRSADGVMVRLKEIREVAAKNRDDAAAMKDISDSLLEHVRYLNGGYGRSR
jgi:methyl-accepting chemotaxis protein